jgi:hypothetical protein
MFHAEDIYPTTRQETRLNRALREIQERENTRYVSYDADRALAVINGPAGFMQISLSRRQAEALATALAIPFKVSQ